VCEPIGDGVKRGYVSGGIGHAEIVNNVIEKENRPNESRFSC
jgi:hypothetical protein